MNAFKEQACLFLIGCVQSGMRMQICYTGTNRLQMQAVAVIRAAKQCIILWYIRAYYHAIMTINW